MFHVIAIVLVVLALLWLADWCDRHPGIRRDTPKQRPHDGGRDGGPRVRRLL